MKKILPAICALAFTGFSFAQTTNGLVAYYSFNNGNANDENLHILQSEKLIVQ